MKVRSQPEALGEAFNRKPVWRRILVLLAGPFANFLFAALAYWILFVVGVPALETCHRRGHGRTRRWPGPA